MSRRRCYRRRRRVVRPRVSGTHVSRVSNSAQVGSISGIIPINVQVPIQVGANAQNISRSDNVSTTTV